MKIAERISELKETKSWKALKSLNNNYAETAIKFLEHIIPILDEIQTIFPFYTRHDAKHGYQVLRRIETVVIDQCFKRNSPVKFSAAELLLLICAAYAHDLGMSVFPGERAELLLQLKIDDSLAWKTSPVLQKYLREYHSERGGSYVDKNADQIEFPRNLIFPLHQLMSSHNWSIQRLENEFANRTAADYQEIDLKQLSCILCIADSIEFSDSRVIDGVLNQLDGKFDDASILSYRENMKHFCIQSSVAIGKDGKIIFSGTFQEPEILNIAHKTIDIIEDWLRNYCDIDYASSKKRLKVRSDSISRNLQSLQFDFERLGIRIKKENIINLISSHSTWSNNPEVAVRELLQNAVEACRYRKFNTVLQNYKPEINVFIDKTNRIITISDNGCGMSRNIVLNNFLTVGNSRSLEPNYKQYNYSPLARFGIGFWSTFILADQVDVETAPFEPNEKALQENIDQTGLKFSVSIQEFKDYTVFTKKNRLAGTKITLRLKSKIDTDILFARISNLLTCSEIPVTFQIEQTINKTSTEISSKDINEVFGTKANFIDTIGVQRYQWKKATDKYEMLIDLYYSVAPRVSFLLWGNTLIVVGDARISQNSFSICGFKVGISEAPSIFMGHSVASFCVDFKDPDGFEYSLDRNNLEQNNKYTEVQEIIRDNLHNAYRDMLIHENVFTPENVYRLNIESRRNRGGGERYFTDSEFKIFEVKYGDLIAFELTKLEKGIEFERIVKEYKNLRELLVSDIEIWCVPKKVSFQFPNGVIGNEIAASIIYQIVAATLISKAEIYFLSASQESTFLIDRYSSIVVDLISLPFMAQKQFDKIPVVKFHTSDINKSNQDQVSINITMGKWPGTVTLCQLNGADYIIYDYSRAFVKMDSELGVDLFFLYKNGDTQKISRIIYLLSQAEAGFIDDSIYKYFPR